MYARTVLLVAACGACAQPLKLAKGDAPTALANHSLSAPNPSERGPFAVRTLFYGSGNAKRRREFRDSLTLKTKTVDGSKFADEKQERLAWDRSRARRPVFCSVPCQRVSSGDRGVASGVVGVGIFVGRHREDDVRPIRL